MARIFVALYNFANKKDDFNTMPPFFESFLKGLKDAGNQVLCFHHKTYGRQFNSEIPSDIKNKVKNFDLNYVYCLTIIFGIFHRLLIVL